MASDLISLLYVSQAADGLAANAVDEIVAVAVSRNAALDITGALVFTGPHFAQVLEGPRGRIEELMTSIERDPRHRDVEVLEVTDIQERCFAKWSLAYAGPSLFVDQHLRPLVEKREDVLASPRRLIDLMQEFISPSRCIAEA